MPPENQSLLADPHSKRLLLVLCAVAFMDFVGTLDPPPSSGRDPFREEE
jgi:hypothetical protein